MSSTSSVAAQQKFTNLRKRLDQLGYRHPLGIESLPLVERLFADLIHTTESLKKAKLQPPKGSKEKGSFDDHIEPYKSDNAKLVKENNELHQQLIKHKEEAELALKDLKSSLRKIEHENADLKFLNNQYVHKIRQLEKESKSKTDKIVQLQEKNFHAVVQTPGGRKKNIPFRRQRMELDSTVPPVDGASDPPTLSASLLPTPIDDPYVADLLRVADDNIARLKDDVVLVTEQREALEGKIVTLRKQVEIRDSEVDRLTRLLEGGRPYDVVALEARNRSNERLISHLNIQIDYLQQKNQDLQQQLDSTVSQARLATTERSQLGSRNAQLSSELKDVDYMASQLQQEKETAIRVADREIVETKHELNKSRSELETMDIEVAKLRMEKDRLAAECSDLQGRLSTETADYQRLEELVAKIQDDKKRLSQRVNKLTSTEKDLVLEIDRLKHRNGTVLPANHKKRAGGRAKSPGRMDGLVRNLEEERDYWKGETEVLQKLLKTRSAFARSSSRPSSRSSSRPGSRPSSRPASPTRASRSTTPSKKNKSRSSSPMNTKTDNKSAAHFEAIMRVLEDERDHYKRECELLKAIKSRPASPTRPRSMRSGDDNSEILKLTRERDELQDLLDKFERHMAEIQANVKVLTNERDKLNGLYEETKEELTRLRREVVRSPKSPKTSLAAQAVLRRVENERDDALADLRRLNTDRDMLQERLKIATETQLTERARLEQKIEDLETALHSLESERSSLEDRIRGLKRLGDDMEHQLKSHAMQLASTRDESSENKTTAEQMRLLADQAERSLEDTTTRLSRREADLLTTNNHIVQLETRISELQRGAMSDAEDVRRLQATIKALDREKDTLQTHVDEKTENVVGLEDNLTAKERMIGELRANVSDLEGALDRARDAGSAKDREIGSLRRQLDATSSELTETGRGREAAARESRRLHDDLATMTRENARLAADLQGVLEDLDTVRGQVQDYVVEVKRAEELLASKEQERTDLLDQYRSLTLEAERYETQTHQLESEGSNMRLELMTRDSEIRRLREKVDGLEHEVQQHLTSEQAYETQVSSLTRSVAGLEDSLRGQEGDKHSLVQDLQAVRDLCARLEANRDNLQRNLTTTTLDHEKLQTLLDDMRHEGDMLRSQVSAERTSVKNLESLLQNNREKEFSSQLTAQERETEVQLYKDRIALNESKMDSQSRELTTIRGRNIELESEVERTRRLLTNERFEKERAVQELRRSGLPIPGETRYRTSGVSPVPRNRSRSPGIRSPYTRSTLDDKDDPLTSQHTV